MSPLVNRRQFLAVASALAGARALWGEDSLLPVPPRVGLCNFACRSHWQAARNGHARAEFSDALGFYEYVRRLGGDGVQTSVRSLSDAGARTIRERVEDTSGYFEADVRLPREASDIAAFESELSLAREAGATVARVVTLGGRRYEVFKSLVEFDAFKVEAIRRLQIAEPLARKHRVRLAWENHKDFLVFEQLEIVRRFDSEWLGVLVDTGNNIALCEDPDAVVDALAPFVASVHLKDMAVQPSDDGFLLSEVPFGTGSLALERIVRTLARANPAACFHIEMATRDPLSVPCRTDGYWAVFAERREADLQRTLGWVDASSPKYPPPRVSGKSFERVLEEEARNNRICLDWSERRVG